MKSKLSILAIAFAVCSLAQAHHSGSVYDNSKQQTWTGTLSKVDWVAPHVLVYLDVKDADGKVTTWTYEGVPPAWYRHNGIKRADVEKGLGKTVKITGSPARTGVPLANLGDIEFPDGSHFRRTAPQGARPAEEGASTAR